MTLVVAQGVGNLAVLPVFSGVFFISDESSTGFTITGSGAAAVVVHGTGITYNVTPGPGGISYVEVTGGVLTSLGQANSLGSQGWAGFSVSAVAAYNAINAQDQTGFLNLFFSGADTFNYSGGEFGSTYGGGGNDVFNITGGWGSTGSNIEGGSGIDTVNLSGGAISSSSPNIGITNVETLNLAAGYDYDFSAPDIVVTTGNTLTISASSLGASNHLSFRVDSAYISTTPTGNLVLIGGAGNDFFEGGKGANIFTGGAGTDTVSFAPGFNETGRLSYSGPGVTANLSIAGFQSLGGLRGGSASFNSIENLIGTPWSDTLTGNSSDNVLDGGSGGNDTLIGGAGNDTLINGTIIDAGTGDDALIMFQGTADGGAGVDTVTLDANFITPPYLTIAHSGRTVTINHVNGISVTLTNVEFAKFINQTIQISGAVMTTADMAASHRQTLALSSLFSVSDIEGEPITKYQLLDSTSDPNSGHFVVGGVVQAANTVIDITAAQLASTSFVTGVVSDTLQIRAFDGFSWSAADNGPWTPFTISLPNVVPVVATAPVAASSHGQAIALSSLITVSDGDGDPIIKYQLWDATDDPGSGHFVINGVAQAERSIIDITAAQVAQTSFVSGFVNDTLHIRASDGAAWSAPDNGAWSPFAVTVPVNHAPVVATANKNATHGQTYALSSLITASDSDNDSITRYQLWDATADPGSGHFVINGVAQPERSIIDITAAQVAQTSFVSGTGASDTLHIRAYDGAAWSAPDNGAWSPFTVTVPVNHAPVVATAPVAASHGQSFTLSSLITASDSDGDPIIKYQLWDATDDPGSGHFVINGVAQAERSIINITAAQVAQTSFVSGFGSDTLHIRASDGAVWSAPDNGAWSPFTVTVPVNHAPVVATAPVAASHSQTIALSSLITVSDSDGDAVTKYQLWDGMADPASGHFVINGVVQAERAVIDITAAQVSQTSFVSGIGVSDTLQIRASDGAAWSAGDNSAWSPFTVTVPVNHAPVVATANKNATHSQTYALSSLITVSDSDSDPITKYQLWDATADPGSGHFVINGVAQPERSIIDITAAQVAQTSFVSGIGANDTLHIRAYDGAAWSAGDNSAWSPFTVTVPANHAPVLTTTDRTLTHSQSQTLSSLITVNDADGDSIAAYHLWDSTADPNSGHFLINGVAQAERVVIDITASQLAQTTFVTGNLGFGGDTLQIRAFDGFAWSAPDNGAWAPFHINVT